MERGNGARHTARSIYGGSRARSKVTITGAASMLEPESASPSASPSAPSRQTTSSKRFRDVLELVDAAHQREVEDLQRKVSDLSKELWRLRDSLREAQQQRNTVSLCASIDEPHMREVTEEIAEELRQEATNGMGEQHERHQRWEEDGEVKDDFLDSMEGTSIDDLQITLVRKSAAHHSSGKVSRVSKAAHLSDREDDDSGDWVGRTSSTTTQVMWEDTEDTTASGDDQYNTKASVHSCASVLDHSDWIESLNLEPVVGKWLTLVDKILVVAGSKRFYELREPWVQTDMFMQKIIVKHKKDQLDFHIFDPASTRQSRTRFGMDSMLGTSSEDRGIRDMTLKTRLIEGNLQCLVLDPQSPKRVAWMFIGMLLVVYDIVVVPMLVFPLPDSIFSDWMKWISQLFWTLDIIVTFFTGVYLDSELCVELKKIAAMYARSWLVMDLIVVVPLWVIELVDAVSSDGGGGSAVRNPTVFFKYFRFLRILRLVRIAKFEHYLQEALAAVNSSALLLLVGIVKLMSVMIILNHLNACIWYAIGRNLPGGWVKEYEDTDIWYRYLTSMHWAITQFQGTSEIYPGIGGQRGTIERLYAVVTIIFALIFLSIFVSSLTNIMMQLESLREERTGLERAVRAYLSVNNISLGLSVRVKRYIDWKQAMNRTTSAGERILELLPKGLQVDVLTEVRGPRILTHDFFNAVQQRHVRQFRMMCHEAFENLQPAPDEWIFMPQDACHQMYFIIAGECRYVPVGRFNHAAGGGRDSFFVHVMEETLSRHKHLTPQNIAEMPPGQRPDIVPLLAGRWVSEAVLWTPWEHTGALISVRDSMLLTLSDTDFARIMKNYPPAHVSAVLYARQFVAGLNRFGKTYTDIIELDSLRANNTND